jgi:hypothetical protein
VLGFVAGGVGFGFGAGGFFGGGGGAVGLPTGGRKGASFRVDADAEASHGAAGSGTQVAVAVFVVTSPLAALTSMSTCTATDWLGMSVPKLQWRPDPAPVIEQEPWLGWRVMRTKRPPGGAGSFSVVCGAGSGPALLTRMS